MLWVWGGGGAWRLGARLGAASNFRKSRVSLTYAADFPPSSFLPSRPMPEPPTPRTDADRALIEAFQQGDEFAFVSLYNRYKQPVYAFCARMLRDQALAQDVMQETFLRVYENRDRLAHAGAFRSWLFTIARNQCLNTIRKTKRQVALEGEPKPSDAMPAPPGPMAQLEKSEQVALVQASLARLKPDYREVLILREYQNLSYEEIAAITRSTLSAVKSRLHKARRKLAEVFAAHEPAPPEAPVPPRRATA